MKPVFLNSVLNVLSDLTTIPANAFRGLSNLLEIELSHGKIQNLDAESFSGSFYSAFLYLISTQGKHIS